MGVFQRTGSLVPGRSVFDLSHDRKLTCDMGELVPILAEECYPGDKFKIGHELVIRFQPLVAPILHQINAYIHLFFVPNRLLWDDWEDFITGGPDGDLAPVLPRFTPSGAPDVAKKTLWDYFGMPVGVIPTGRLPLAFPWRGYNKIYNDFYRDQNLIDEVDLDSNVVQYRAWTKDYFTSALPWQQRGTEPALPVGGIVSADFAGSVDIPIYYDSSSGATYDTLFRGSRANNIVNVTDAWQGTGSPAGDTGPVVARFNSASLNSINTIDLTAINAFTPSEMRLAFQLQHWMERNARCGARYNEQTIAHFGVNTGDARLQRPEYIGGMKAPVIISEVLQTSETATSPQGNLAGHGISVQQGFSSSYYCREHGWIIGILSVMPMPAYQQGIDRIFLRETKFDYYFPEFAGLSEQAIERVELYATNVQAENETVFGFQGRYNELRHRRSVCCSDMRDDMDYWHLARQFAAPPVLNQSFIECKPDKRIFAVQNVDGLIVNCGNLIQAIRPLPLTSEPGLIDHF